jgi:hypothetical protein
LRAQGRVRRYKKIKAIDPFSKTHGVVDTTGGRVYDVAPKAHDVEKVPSKLRAMMKRRVDGHGKPAAGGSAGVAGAAFPRRDNTAGVDKPGKHFQVRGSTHARESTAMLTLSGRHALQFALPSPLIRALNPRSAYLLGPRSTSRHCLVKQ